MAVALVLAGRSAGADPVKVEFDEAPGRLVIRVGGDQIGTYVYAEEKIPRPYFKHLRVPGGPQVTRNHPPVADKDPTDHDTFHPGLWLAFGDLSGADNWRNKTRVRHVEFAEKPDPATGRFAVRNEYLSADGKTIVCRETCRYTVVPRRDGVLLVWDSEFRSDDAEFAFGDQEEMGLGVRVATTLTAKNGGKITTSSGDVGEKQVRGTAADWCDFSGTIDGRPAGIALMPDPKNFRPSWYHARDYGLIVANPFGRKALTKGETSRVVVSKGEAFRLRFGVLVHAGADVKAAYNDFLDLKR
jgi:hypothetical protein